MEIGEIHIVGPAEALSARVRHSQTAVIKGAVHPHRLSSESGS